jgi:hypothetical protein
MLDSTSSPSRILAHGDRRREEYWREALWSAARQLTGCRFCISSLLELLPEASFRRRKAAARQLTGRTPKRTEVPELTLPFFAAMLSNGSPARI